MKTYPLNEARAEFSKLIDRALGGTPQRVTRYGKDAVVIVAEADWEARKTASESTQGKETGFSEVQAEPPKAQSLGALLADYLETHGGLETDRPWKDRELGRDIE